MSRATFSIHIPYQIILAFLLAGPNLANMDLAPDRLSPPLMVVSAGAPQERPSGWAYRPAISGDGRYVAFTSSSASLVQGDTNRAWDVFVRDLDRETTERVSVSSEGTQANNHSGYWCAPSISADGRFVAFASLADNLVPRDTNRSADVFVHDLLSGRTGLISHLGDGRPADGWSDCPAISPDGRYVSFSSLASNLVDEDGNQARDIFLADRLTGRIERVSVTGKNTEREQGSGWASAVSEDGLQVVFSGSENETRRVWDVYVRDLSAGETILASQSSRGQPGNGDSGKESSLGISADGRYVVFQSAARNLVTADGNSAEDIFVRDWAGKKTWRVSLDSQGNPGQGDCVWPAISPDGRFVSFSCSAPNLVEEDANQEWDVFIRDRLNHHINRISRSVDGVEGNQPSGYWTASPLSQDAKRIAYSSAASNLTSDDTNPGWDVFLAQPAYYRGLDIVNEARKEIGMPYCQRPEPDYRGCPKDQSEEGCQGKYQGFYCGVCTDLVMDALRLGSGIDLGYDLQRDLQEHPEREYRWDDPRSADDMANYYRYTGRMLAREEGFLPGDIAFFDWEADGIVDHVGIISGLDETGKPAFIIEALGTVGSNPDGLAKELSWMPYHEQHYAGHAHP